MKRKKVSIIVPVYNVEYYLSRCIESILNQSFENYELLLINDGSTDSSFKICNKYANKDTRVHIFNKKNGGLSDARNYGLTQVNSEYVVFVDSDDYLEKDYLNKLYQCILRKDADVGMCGFFINNKEGDVISKALFNERTGDIISGHQFLYHMFEKDDSPYVVVWNKIYKTSVFKGMRFEKGINHEDEFIVFPLFWSIKKIAVCNEPLYNYVHRKDSITHSESYSDKMRTLDLLYQRRMDFCKRKDKSFYVLSCNFYKNWIIDTIGNKKIKLERKEMDHFQKQYRKIIKSVSFSKGKLILRDLLGIFNIRLAAFFYCHFWFPFYKIKFNSRVVLYGYGKAGQDFAWQIRKSHYCKLVGIVDTNWENILDAKSPELLKYWSFDYIIISAQSPISINGIRNTLLKLDNSLEGKIVSK